MILNCNACGKKFVVPDKAITSSGRLVQCGSCGNKWKQYPIGFSEKSEITPKQQNIRKISKVKKAKKVVKKQSREISLYSPEYLAKKHGINLNEEKSQIIKNRKDEKKVYFGFYSSVIVFIFLFVLISRLLYFSQNIIVSRFPILEFYISNYFESLRNIFDMWKNLVIIY